METCIDIHGDPFAYFCCDYVSRGMFCIDSVSVNPDGSTYSRFSCIESEDIFYNRNIDNQDNECELSFCKCRTSDKVKNRNVCSDNATWYIITEPCGYWEDVRYPLYCKRGRSINYRSKCDDMWLENPGCYYPVKRTGNVYGSIADNGNNCHN